MPPLPLRFVPGPSAARCSVDPSSSVDLPLKFANGELNGRVTGFGPLVGLVSALRLIFSGLSMTRKEEAAGAAGGGGMSSNALPEDLRRPNFRMEFLGIPYERR